jgi:hypothetical protein
VQVVSTAHAAPSVFLTVTPRSAGDLLLVFATFGGEPSSKDGVFSLGDTSETSFEQLSTQSSVSAHGDSEIGDVYLGFPASASSDTVVANETGGTGSGILEVVEIAGANATAPLDTVGTSVGGTSISVTTHSPVTSLNDLVLAVSEYYGNGGITRQSFSPAGTGEVNEAIASIGGQNPMSLAFSVQDASALAAQHFAAQLASNGGPNSEFVFAISPST